MNTFAHETVYGKSRVFIERALQCRDAADHGSFQLWAAIALELLAKAALAHIHPVLIADPNSADSLFAACGKNFGPKRRTIPAKTTFERTRKAVDGFGADAHEFCELMAERRNAELHSGVVATSPPESWLAKYWSVTKLLLNDQGLSLGNWVGATEAADAEAVIAQAMTVLEQVVKARIRRHLGIFDERYPAGSTQRLALDAQAGFKGRLIGFGSHDLYVEETCPACKRIGMVGAELEFEEVDGLSEDEPWLEIVRREYSHQEFRCGVCGLVLRGRDELEVADLETESEDIEERAPDSEPEYGNE